MRLLGWDVPIPRLVLAALALALVAALVVGVATTGAAFAPFNSDWQGASELRSSADAAGGEPVVATDIDRYESIDASGTVAFVLAPEARSPADRAAMRSFVERGGRLVVATSDPAAGNELLSALGVDVQVAGPTLRDDVEYRYGPAFPTVTSTANHTTVRDVSGLTLNYGTALTIGEDARPLANSSTFSYLDLDGNGAPGPDERLAARPVVGSQEIGDGTVIVASDPSIFINAMLENEPNRQFVRNLVGERDRVMLDRTDDGVPPLRAVLLWIRGQSLAPALLGTLFVGLIAVWVRGLHRRAFRRARRIYGREHVGDELSGASIDGRASRSAAGPGRPAVDRDALESYLAERYPEWDPERRQRVLGGVMADDPEGGDDARVD